MNRNPRERAYVTLYSNASIWVESYVFSRVRELAKLFLSPSANSRKYSGKKKNSPTSWAARRESRVRSKERVIIEVVRIDRIVKFSRIEIESDLNCNS